VVAASLREVSVHATSRSAPLFLRSIVGALQFKCPAVSTLSISHS
jgi:hypothetical protein